jgi:adenylate cyclase
MGVLSLTLKDDIDGAVEDLTKTWNTTTWGATRLEVPDPNDMGYSDGKKISATFFYADMADSSGLVAAAKDPEVVASVISTYLKACVRAIRNENGHIRSFDGDRVMGVFSGTSTASRAARAALRLNYAVTNMLDPAIQSAFPSLKEAGWHLRHASGIASGDTLMVRAGIRNNSDLVSIGVGPNLAAKLSDERDGDYRTLIGAGSHKALDKALHTDSKGAPVWLGPYDFTMGGGTYSYYKSRHHVEIS